MRPHTRAALAAASIALATALTTGCDTVQPSDITKEQAVERVAARAQEAFAQLPPGATLKMARSEPDMPCGDGPNGRTFVETKYTIDYPSQWPVQQSIPTLADYWAAHDYKIVQDRRTDDRLPALGVEHSDGFRINMSLTYRDSGRIDAYLISSSPCM